MGAPYPIPDDTPGRAASSMDTAARGAILKTLRGVSKSALVDGFLSDRYDGLDEYAAHVRERWGDAAAQQLRGAVAQAAIYQPILVRIPTEREREEMVGEAVLLHMPESEFRLCVSRVSGTVAHPARTAKRISAICRRLRLPWEFTVNEGFRRLGRGEDSEPEETNSP